MKTYILRCEPDARRAYVEANPSERAKFTRELNLRRDLKGYAEHPDWGFGGSGAGQLALGILCDLLADDNRALLLLQPFKKAVLAGLDRNRAEIRLDSEVLMEQVRAVEKALAAKGVTTYRVEFEQDGEDPNEGWMNIYDGSGRQIAFQQVPSEDDETATGWIDLRRDITLLVRRANRGVIAEAG